MSEAPHKLRIVIPGGSGHLGQLLAGHFHNQGHSVTVLSRRPRPAPWQAIAWDGRTPGDWITEIDGADVVINLAGRSVNCRYTPGNRREILESRTLSTEAIGKAIAQSSRPPDLWMNASTATIYRHAFDRPMDEATGELGGHEPDAPASWRFSIEVATRWEEAFFSATPGSPARAGFGLARDGLVAAPVTRKIALRSAVVMSTRRGSPFDILLNLVRAGLGGKAGSGRQFVSWIHETDFVRAIDFLIANWNFEGCVNLSSPAPLPNREFMRVLREAWGTRIGLPAAKWMLEIGAWLLRTETELILKSRRVIPGRLLDAGFQFSFPDWRSAACDLIEHWRQRDQCQQLRAA